LINDEPSSTVAMDAESAGATGERETLKSIQDPLEPLNYGSTRQLFGEVHDFLAQHPGLDENSLRALTYFAFATLFPEYAPIWPFLSVVAEDAIASTLLLRLLRCVFLQSMHLADVSLAGLISISQSPGQVLVIDQATAAKGLERVLSMMSRPGAGVLSKGQVCDVCRPLVVCTAEPLRDSRLLEQGIQILLMPTRCRLPNINYESLEKTSKEMRARLLQYRENNLAKVCSSQFDAPELNSPTRAIAALLGTCIIDDTELQAGVIPLLKNQDQDARVRRSSSPRAVVIEAGLFLCHEAYRTQARVGEFASIATGILKGRGEALELEPRAVGSHLRALGLFSERLGPAGRGIRFANEIRRKIHKLAQAYEVRSIQDGTDRCEFCAQAKSRFGEAPDRSI
jgi:hypothetical protein